MSSVPDPATLGSRDQANQVRSIRRVTAGLSAFALVVGGYLGIQSFTDGPTQALAAPPLAPLLPDVGAPVTPDPLPPVSTTPASTTTTSMTTTSTLLELPPPHFARYVVPDSEAAPEAKQLAVDIAQWLTTYEADEDHESRLTTLPVLSGGLTLGEAAGPLIYSGQWSRGEIVYPQLGGLRNNRASVMVVTSQTVGSGSQAEFTVVRTLDIRLVMGGEGWEFDYLSSAGGTFDNVGDLTLAHAVAADPRIEMPDSARLDILSGLVSPVLLRVMADIAEQTPYGVVVLATGHPHHVFETDRTSHHTTGRAVDIYRVGDRNVIDDRHQGSATRALVEWLLQHPDVRQVGSPWDLDGSSSRSFTDAVHQDHLHVAVNAAP